MLKDGCKKFLLGLGAARLRGGELIDEFKMGRLQVCTWCKTPRKNYSWNRLNEILGYASVGEGMGASKKNWE